MIKHILNLILNEVYYMISSGLLRNCFLKTPETPAECH